MLKLPKCQERHIIKNKLLKQFKNIYNYLKEKYKEKKSTQTHKAISSKF